MLGSALDVSSTPAFYSADHQIVVDLSSTQPLFNFFTDQVVVLFVAEGGTTQFPAEFRLYGAEISWNRTRQ